MLHMRAHYHFTNIYRMFTHIWINIFIHTNTFIQNVQNCVLILMHIFCYYEPEIEKGQRAMAIIEFNSIWFVDSKFGVSLRLQQVMVEPSAKLPAFAFNP